MNKREHIQTLMDLGLTLLQAKIYLALCQTGTATAKTISKVSNVARQDIYRIMPTLKKSGLAEKILTTPTMYKPLPLKDGYNLLLQKETEEYINLKNKTSASIKSLNESNNKIMLQDENPDLAITYSESILFKKLEEGIKGAQVSIDLCGSQYGIKRCFFITLSSFKSAIKRGVKIRVLTEKQYDNKSLENILQTLKNSPLFEIRYHSLEPQINFMIYDGKETNFCLGTPADKTGLPSLWTYNPRILIIAKAYFEKQWESAYSLF